MNLEVVCLILAFLSLVNDCWSVTENKTKNGRQVIMYPQGKSSKGSALIMLNGIGNNNQSEIDDQQLYTLSNNVQTLSNLVTAQTNLISTLSLELAKMKRQLFDLDLKAGKDDYKNQTKALKTDLANTKRELVELKDQIKKANSVNSKVSKVEKSLKSLDKDIEEVGKKSKRYDIKHNKAITGLKRDLKTLSSKKPTFGWPSGHYCILANGKCPGGFKRLEGYLNALYMYSSGKSYVKEAKFGDSLVGCYGSYCGQYGNWIGKLKIVACCK